MQIPKQQIMDMLRDTSQPGDSNKADQADQELPEQVDTDNGQHQGMLQKYGVDPQQLISRLGSKFGF